MKAQHAVVGTAMRRNVFAWRKDAEKRGPHVRHLLQEPRRLWTLTGVIAAIHADAGEPVSLPAIVAKRADAREDVLNVGQLLVAIQHAIQLGANDLPLRRESVNPREQAASYTGTSAWIDTLDTAPSTRLVNPIRSFLSVPPPKSSCRRW